MKIFNLKRMNEKRRAFGIKKARILEAIGLLYLVLALSACASMKSVPKKFSPQVHANIGIFADTTITLITEADLGLAQDQTIFIREYFDLGGKEEKELFVKNGK